MPSFSYFTVHLGLKRPPGTFLHHNLIIPDSFLMSFEELYRQRQFPTHPVVYLNETALSDPTSAPPGRTNLFAVVSSPASESHLDWETLKVIARDRVYAALERVGYGVSPDEVEVELVQTPKTFEERDGNYRGSLYGVDESARPMKGMFPPSVRDRDFRNLFYAGGSVQPGAGLPMVILSGKFAAAQV
jgi:phytoene dehydrogenase-like protein